MRRRSALLLQGVNLPFMSERESLCCCWGGLTPHAGPNELLLLRGGNPPEEKGYCYWGGLTGVWPKNVLLLLFVLLTYLKGINTSFKPDF